MLIVVVYYHSSVEFLRHFSANMAINRGLLLLNALYAEASASASIGDRFVLEVHYTQQYQELPLTVDAAEKDGWTVSEECITGLGRRAHSTRFPNLWHDRNGALHLWFDHLGSVMGFGVSAESGVSDPWRRVGDHYEIDFLTRDPEAACGNGPKAKLGSVGDRLLLVNKHDVQALPVTLQGAFDEKFHDGGPCFPEMGWHMMLNRFDVSSPTPVYSGADGGLLAMNLNSYATQQTPSFEYPAPKEGKAVYGWHVYFRDHVGACQGAPTAYALPFAETPASKERTDFSCTPFFGNLWVQTLATVVDAHASPSVCKDAGVDGRCAFVHYMGPTTDDVYGTPCTPPSPTDQCHCYHQVTYTENCKEKIMSSHVSGSVDTADMFDEHGVLRSCSGDVVTNVVIGWAPPANNPTACDCNAAALQV